MIKQRILWFSTIILLAGMLVLGAAGCQKAAPKTAATGDVVKVVTTNFPPYDFAKQVGGENAEVTMLVPPGAESHSYEPTPQDILKIQDCDLFIYGGGDSDAWIDGILSSIDNPKMKKVAMMDCVKPVVEETVAGMEDKNNDGNDSADSNKDTVEYDEHVWLNPKNAEAIVDQIRNELDAIAPDNAAAYDQNAIEYTHQLDDLDKRFKEMVDGSVRKTIVVGDRFPFRYLTDAYGLKYYAAFPGCSTETEPSAATVAFLIDEVKKEKIPVVFHTELSNEKMADTIVESTGAGKRQLNACHNVTQDDFNSGKTYLDYMNENVDALREALY
ncbi:metal ABC transporter substrate-binding protein [Eubacterium sp. 1001713B170207_170306_E7]|uniref:metal ABC transporter substrate-binding protein n=1 Tax=Eubacterium sp. 1001713B170207_170306_E7 TaxID=2787097 RepID=UPI00189766E1|nr:metal ABC transporter substrate-binding protein [Eubacterium sp. 1001713B170207_170306_E7]